MLWISLVLLYASSGYCQNCITDDSTPAGKGTPNTPCVFPFVHKNQTSNGCKRDSKGRYWCSTKVEAGTNKHIKMNWGFCPSDCDRSCAQDETCKLIEQCSVVAQEFTRYKSLTKNHPEKSTLRTKLKSLVCNSEPKKFCCRILVETTTEKLFLIAEPQVETTVKTLKRTSYPPSCQTEPTSNFLGNMLPRSGSCGLSCNTDARVVKGEDAKLGEFPWAALLGYQATRRKWVHEKGDYEPEQYVKYGCGGTLINTWYVLTAAHCHNEESRRKRIYQVFLGEWEVSDKAYHNKDPDCAAADANSCLPKVQKILVDNVVIHNGYSHERTGIFNDIALVRLKTEAVLNVGVQLACLPIDDIVADQLQIIDFGSGLGGYTGTVIGWGHTKNQDGGDLRTHHVAKAILQKAKLPLWSIEDCQDRMPALTIGSVHLCAGGGSDGADSCKGDSGGGIFIRKNTSNLLEQKEFGYVEVGLVSFGSPTCGDGTPGVYTRLSEYIPWIQQNIKP